MDTNFQSIRLFECGTFGASGGQERLSPFHAMGNNLASLVVPNGLRGYNIQKAAGVGMPEMGGDAEEINNRISGINWSKSNPHSGSFWRYSGGGGSAEINSIYYENNEITFFTNIVAKFGYIDSRYGIVGPFLASADGENDGAIMKSMEEYDYSIAEIPGKREEDLNYIINGIGGNYLTRWYKTVKRDWNGSSTDQKIDFGITVATAPIGGIGGRITKAAAKTGMKAIEAGSYTFTKTAAKHLSSRPYMNSPSTITNIMKSGKGVPDATFKGGVNYKVPGTFNGSQGVWELGINPQTNTIYHFLFKSVK